MNSDENISELEVKNDEANKNISIHNMSPFKYKNNKKQNDKIFNEENVITTEFVDSVDNKINKQLYNQSKTLKSNLSNKGWRFSDENKVQVKISLLENNFNDSDASITPHAAQEDRSSSFLSINYKPNQSHRLSQDHFNKQRRNSSKKSYFSEKQNKGQSGDRKNDLEKFTPNLYRFVEEKKINRVNFSSKSQQVYDQGFQMNLQNTKINRRAQIHVTTIMEKHKGQGLMDQIHQASRNLSCIHYDEMQNQSQSSTPKGILKFKSGSSLEVSQKSPSKQSIGSQDSKKVKFLLSQRQANKLLEQERINKFQESVGSPRKNRIKKNQ